MGSAASDTRVRDGSTGTYARVQYFQNACHSSADFYCAHANSYIRGPGPQNKSVCGLGEKSHPMMLAQNGGGFSA
jgi:hypothetical protein